MSYRMEDTHIEEYKYKEAIQKYKQFCNDCSLYDYTNKICLKNHRIKSICIYIISYHNEKFESDVIVRKIGGCGDFIQNPNIP